MSTYTSNDTGITELIKTHPLVTPEDTVRRAAGLIKGSEGSRLVVVSDGGVVGAITERAISSFLAATNDLDAAMLEPIGPLVEPHPVFLSSSVSLEEAMQVFSANDVDMLPVIGSHGMVHGVVYRSDVIGCLTRTLRPPTIAGMATPLGVYLTTGSLRGGAGSPGLFLTGVAMMLMITASTLFVDVLQSVVSRFTHINLAVVMASAPLSLRPNIYDLALYLSTGLTAVIMLALLRLSPLAGYHAAEHMTVHAIEAGEALTPESSAADASRAPKVRDQSDGGGERVYYYHHQVQWAVRSAGRPCCSDVGLAKDRRLAAVLRVTTKPPTQEQLNNGIAAGEQLIERYQRRPGYQVSGFQRMWNMGFLQVLLGMGATIGLLTLLQGTASHSDIMTRGR